jgi:hypothetical protein
MPMSAVEQQKLTKDERIAAMRAKCEAKVGVACSAGCEKSCVRNKTERELRKGRAAAAERQRVARAASVENRTKADADREAKRIGKYRVQIKSPKIEGSGEKRRFTKDEAAVETWRVTVLYMLGLTVEKAAEALYGSPEIRKGAVNKVVTRYGLEETRKTRPIERLLELDRSPVKGIAPGEVAHYAALYNRAYLKAFEHRRGIVPEQQLQAETKARITRLVNISSSALTSAARDGGILHWNLEAGFEMQRVHAASPGGSIGGMNTSGLSGQGQAGDAEKRALAGLMRAQKLGAARQAILDYWKIQMTGPLRAAVIDWVVIRNLPLEAFEFPSSVTDEPVAFLNDSLEALAYHFDKFPAGVRRREPTLEEWKRYDAAMAADGARRKRLFGG